MTGSSFDSFCALIAFIQGRHCALLSANVDFYLPSMGISRRIHFRSPQATALKVAGLNVCRVKYTSSYHPLPIAETILKDRAHVLYLPTKQRWESRSKNTLWWNVNSNALSLKRTVRSWCNRRLRIAVIEALRSHGFDADGKLLGDNGDVPHPGLRGTLAVTALPCLVTTKFTEVRIQTNLLIQALKRRTQ